MDAATTIYLTLLGALGGYILGATIADPQWTVDGLRGLWETRVRMFRTVIRAFQR